MHDIAGYNRWISLAANERYPGSLRKEFSQQRPGYFPGEIRTDADVGFG